MVKGGGVGEYRGSTPFTSRSSSSTAVVACESRATSSGRAAAAAAGSNRPQSSALDETAVDDVEVRESAMAVLLSVMASRCGPGLMFSGTSSVRARRILLQSLFRSAIMARGGGDNGGVADGGSRE